MTSNLGCIGLHVDDEQQFMLLVDRLYSHARLVGDAGGVRSLQWTDPGGARLTLGLAGQRLDDLLPSYAGEPGARLAGVSLVAPGVVAADVYDAEGELATRLTCELEQWRHLDGSPVSGQAALTAFGNAVTVHADETAFAASPASLLSPPGPGEPVADDALRLAPESFFSYGVFGDPADADGAGRLAGTVVASRTHTVAETGQSFHAVRVAVLGMEVDLCLAADEHPERPAPGCVVAGEVHLVASLPELWAQAPVPSPRRRGWFRRS